MKILREMRCNIIINIIFPAVLWLLRFYEIVIVVVCVVTVVVVVVIVVINLLISTASHRELLMRIESCSSLKGFIADLHGRSS